MKIKIWQFFVYTIVVVLAVQTTESFFSGGFIAQMFKPTRSTGTIVSINSFLDGETVVGVDFNNDGKADVKAYTNSVLGNDIMSQCCQLSDGESDGYFTEIKMFSPVKAEVLRCTVSNGTFWEKIIPKYLVLNYYSENPELVSETTPPKALAATLP